jgi:acyl-CoA reductase-like NAD-dependent aldehyde dehydrogenase
LAHDAPPPVDAAREPFERIRAAWRAQVEPSSVDTRLEKLKKLKRWVLANQPAVAQAISQDFGHRPAQETVAAELAMIVAELDHTVSHLRGWALPEPRDTFVGFLPGSSRVVRQPRGVVGILSPWNYPFMLAVDPLIGAIAAGNRALIKPSEYSPHTAEVLTRMCAEVFAADEVAVVTGGPEVGAAFTRLPFDLLFFTGSTSVGKHVMRAAAENLTPVVLELGGKSPVIVHPRFDLRRAAQSIAAGKLLNAGQTCIAPDYVLTDRPEALASAIEAEMKGYYPRFVDNNDYCSIATDRHHARLGALLDDAQKKGATIRVVNPGNETPSARKMLPVLVLGATDDMLVMQDEIFGPILPIVDCRGFDEAIRFVNDRPRPLALYYFDDDSGRVEQVLSRTTSGGVTVNDTLFQIAQPDLPFGGVGPAGLGSYHGFDGFRVFSHEKGVFEQTRLNGVRAVRPPYGKLFDLTMKLLVR